MAAYIAKYDSGSFSSVVTFTRCIVIEKKFMLFLKIIRIVLKRQIVSCLVYRILFIDSEGEERQEPNQIPVDPEFPDFLDFSNSAKTFGTIFY